MGFCGAERRCIAALSIITEAWAFLAPSITIRLTMCTVQRRASSLYIDRFIVVIPYSTNPALPATALPGWFCRVTLGVEGWELEARSPGGLPSAL